MPAVAAMAKRWSTAFVEPPRALTTTMAFSKDFLLTISHGFRSRWSSGFTALATREHSSRFSGDVAGDDELCGRERPSASMAQAIVFEVDMPP
mmetsp:Transcript_45029/g.79872  ORF Transcript_45029/g.79872 Transcript_45029/m.79872 type:complete len:93 (-) Transcript_45029:694-972(-)